MVDVVCVGNALIDVFLSIQDSHAHCRLNHETGEFCVKAGEKIPLEEAVFQLGGNASNVAVGLSRLGFSSALIAEIGNEAFSNKIWTELELEEVDLSHLIVSKAPSSFAMGINFKKERTLFVHHVERQHHFTYDGFHPQWVYLSSMGESWRHVYREVPAYVRRVNAKLAFNPGTRQIAAGHDALQPALEASHILFVNKEEGELLLHGKERPEETSIAYKKDLMTALQKQGPQIVVLTDGDHGALAISPTGEFFHQHILEAPVVEKTGAGDSFATGFLAAHMHDQDIQTSLLWGAANASSVVGKVGAQPGLLTKVEMERKIKQLL